MRLEDIQVALEEASRVSRQNEFVIAGSLSVLGRIDIPPVLMSMSNDIDFYPLRDPGRAGEIARVLGEDSEFHERHGFYLDPVSPELPVLPDEWRARLSEIQLGTVTAYFLEVNDTAISKYARGFDNDYRWLDAGFEHGVLNLDTIRARARFGTFFPLPEDKDKTVNGIRQHEAALRDNGTLARGLLTFLRSDPPKSLNELNTESGQYSGAIVWQDEFCAVQSTGRGGVVVHSKDSLKASLALNDSPMICYRDGQATVTQKRTRSSGLSLG
jgi:hypothetical protein